MLSREENETLTRVGPGTPMGKLLRRYWHPVCAAEELTAQPVKPVRLLGEDLVLYRDLEGRHGLIDRHCPHRRADMSFALPERCGLRCSYHGWLFDEAGQCREVPFDDLVHPEARFREKVKIKAYPVEVKAGLVWAYLGPQPVPGLPDWVDYHERGFKQIAIIPIPCNWLQCQENSIDPVHFEWLHLNWTRRMVDPSAPAAPRHTEIAFEEFEFGFIYRRRLEGVPENDLWRIGRACVLPNMLYVGGRFGWNVPIDDENTLRIAWRSYPLPGTRPFHQERIPYWYPGMRDPGNPDGPPRRIENQDIVAMVGQGAIADRTQEHLGTSDRGVIMLRKQFSRDLKRVAEGNDPLGVIRDVSKNHKLALPGSQQGQPDFDQPEGPFALEAARLVKELSD